MYHHMYTLLYGLRCKRFALTRFHMTVSLFNFWWRNM